MCLDRCVTCGHAFQRTTQEEKCNRDVQLEYFGDEFAERRGFFLDLYESINARRTLRALKGKSHQRVLEIGPGSGRIMACVAQAGHNVCGLDLSPAVARHIKARWNLVVHVEPLDAHMRRVGPAYYDVIVMRHVLEHFPDPCEALCTIHTLLKQDGLLYIAVPNMDSWHRSFHGWSGYQPYHVHYFNRQSLCWALTQSGFRMAHFHTYESLTGWTNSLVQSMRRRGYTHQNQLGHRKRRSRWMILEVVRFALGVVIWPLRSLQSVLGQGEELNVLAVRVPI